MLPDMRVTAVTSEARPSVRSTTVVAGSTGKVRLGVLEKELVADGVCRLVLADPDGRRLPDWAPGAHIDLSFESGHTRQYSLCGDRWDPFRYEIAVLRERAGRGGSAYIHDRLRPGDVVEVAGPRNNFALAPSERYLFIAGGIGITPLLPMLQQAELTGIPWTLLYGGRHRASMAFLDRLIPFGDRVLARPEDERGLLDLGLIDDQPAGTKIYCCGPAPLLAAVEERCGRLGLPGGTLRVERFVARDQGAPVRSTPFDVVLARSGRTVTIQPGTSILDAAAAAGVPILASCRQGTCGTCETRLVEGVADHRDSLLDEDERRSGDRLYPCVSRAASDRIVLDV